jgi:NTE family protein
MAGEKTALVLSAGGMFGAYQAGVWQAIRDVFSPDIVVGASVGSLNGYLIASGYPAEDLACRWQSLEALEKLSWRIPRQLKDGLLQAELLDNWIQEIVEQQTPQREFGVVVTRFRGLKRKLFRAPNVRWQHLAASCAVPLFLRAHELDGELYSDGGLIDPLPLWAAIEMGAMRIVAVNVMARRPLPLRAVARALQLCTSAAAPNQKGVTLVRIEPSEPLGSALDTMYWTKSKATRWVQLGRRDAHAAKHLVVECIKSSSAVV